MEKVIIMNRYYLKDKYIYIYGAGSAGAELLSILMANNMNVLGFIDRRKNIENYRQLEVINLFNLKEKIKEKDEVVIIISVRNVFDHNAIAKELFDFGFKNIIFKPNEILKNVECNSVLTINAAYDELFGEKKVSNNCIDSIKTIKRIISRDEGYIQEKEDLIFAYIPFELLFTNNNGTEWGNINFSTYISIKLFQAIKECNNNIVSVIDDYVLNFSEKISRDYGMKIDKEWRNNVIQGRIDIFYEMEKKLDRDYDFFVQNCASVRIRKEGGFILTSSGKNRISFLISMGHKYIPVKLSKKEYKKYINYEVVKKINDFIENKPPLLAPIPHPYFYSLQYQAYNYSEIWIKKIVNIVSEFVKENNSHYSEISIFDYIKDSGCLSRVLHSMGCKVTRKVSDSSAELFDSLFYMDTNKFKDNKDNMQCDISVVDFKLVDLEDILKKTNKICCIFVKENLYNEIEMISKANCFVVKDKLFTSWWGKEFVNAYCLRRDK